MKKIKEKLLNFWYSLPKLKKFIPPVLMLAGLTCLVIGAFLFGLKFGVITLAVTLISLSILLTD